MLDEDDKTRRTILKLQALPPSRLFSPHRSGASHAEPDRDHAGAIGPPKKKARYLHPRIYLPVSDDGKGLRGE